MSSLMEARNSSRNYHQDFAPIHPNIHGKRDFKKRRWSSEEDSKLVKSISIHGEGRWNSLACLAGLNRTGKSCRLRWLNYLRPNVRRGNLTVEEQLLILQLRSLFGNRWSSIAEHLPGRTDNEIKNYWRTRVQKQARRLNCDPSSDHFRETLRNLWLPRLEEHIRAASSTTPVQFRGCLADHYSYIPTNQTGVGHTFTSYEPHVPSAWNGSLGSHGFEKCSSSALMGLDDQDFVTGYDSQDIILSRESFWHLGDQQTLKCFSSYINQIIRKN